MLNRCTLIGNLGADPEIRAMPNGDEVANFSLAVTKKWKDKNGEKKEKTEWLKVTVFGGTVKVVKDYVKKGSKIFVTGELQTRKWQDKDGNDRYTTEIVLQNYNGQLVLLGGKSDGSTHNQQTADGYAPQGGQGPVNLDDEIPFSPCFI